MIAELADLSVRGLTDLAAECVLIQRDALEPQDRLEAAATTCRVLAMLQRALVQQAWAVRRVS